MEKYQRARSYIAIDLKSFYASVECVERGLDALTTRLVVADESRTDKTICLAVSPALKAYGLSGRCRLFEVRQKAREVQKQTGKALDYLVAPPRMQLYMDYSQRIYGIYLKYIGKEDIHVYSIDEVFMDVTEYLHLYRNPDGSQMTPHALAMTIIRDVLRTTGITATAGIGTNLYLCKIAMDIDAKHVQPDADGVRIAELDEQQYRRRLWNHRPLTSFWRIGAGTSRKLEANGMYTMGDVARMSLRKCYYDPDSWREDYPALPGAVSGEDLLFRLFGVDAEILIDHAWGLEPTRMEDIKQYRPSSSSICSGQVLGCSYTSSKACLVLREMVDSMALELVGRQLVTNQVVLDVGYDREVPSSYRGQLHRDRYGRTVPKPSHGSIRLDSYSSSGQQIMEAAVKLYREITDDQLLVHRLTVTFSGVISEEEAREKARTQYEQLNLFDYLAQQEDPEESLRRQEREEKERKMQEAMLRIKGKYGKNAIVKGMNLEEGATMMERNGQIGGHRA